MNVSVIFPILLLHRSFKKDEPFKAAPSPTASESKMTYSDRISTEVMSECLSDGSSFEDNDEEDIKRLADKIETLRENHGEFSDFIGCNREEWDSGLPSILKEPRHD